MYNSCVYVCMYVCIANLNPTMSRPSVNIKDILQVQVRFNCLIYPSVWLGQRKKQDYMVFKPHL